MKSKSKGEVHLEKSRDEIDRAEKEIREKQKFIDYQVRAFPISVIVEKFKDLTDEDGELIEKSELFIPDNHRGFVWNTKLQSKFIESILLDLPIPFLFVADIYDEGEENEGRIEIIDGAQRIQTISSFLNGELVLDNLKQLETLNGFRFQDLPKARRFRFNRTPLRMIELRGTADKEVRQDIFERINISGVMFSKMEIRKYSIGGKLHDLIQRCAESPLFKEVCPISETRAKRQEGPELVLRFFAYTNNYLNLKKSVVDFLDDYLKAGNELSDTSIDKMEKEFIQVLEYVKKYFPSGFSKSETNRSVPRIRFEAIAVGVTLAFRKASKLKSPNLDWLTDTEFLNHTRSDASNSAPRVQGRIEYVRDQLLS
ncbi:MAG: hypothetical protein COB67_04935 [SAR324 cluster bacterium]|uniref:GmrSD restriction endonucleases N-terminal domain-containing protein n=1 Tax=SAR324 cluster bacterium TaxID=2024889 RepID=A0A2A4T7H5_9DELT|nr:MAG: hypothetical protein COB67_04935 [SAR324 cluster bacterium]